MKVCIAVKGGEHSGNFGHSGRPGLVGGSTAGGKLAIATYEWLKDQPFAVDEIDASLTQELEDGFEVNLLPTENNIGILRAIVRGGVPRHHLDKLEHIVAFGTKFLTTYPPCTGFQYADPYTGQYNTTIGVHEDRAWTTIAIHEIGHHIYNVLHPSSILSHSGLVMQRVLGKLRDYGLRSYSMSNDNEFVADTYKVGLLGKPEHKSKLLELWNKVTGNKFSSLLDLFEV
jgi:hypothetical protein